MSVLRANERHRVTIGENVFCTCTPSQRADRKTCCHVVWVYVNLFNLQEDNPLLPQVFLDRANLTSLIRKCPDDIPENLSRCLQKVGKRNFPALILQHPKCQEEQMWVVSRKSTNRYSTCAGCDKKKCIGPNALYLCVSGLLLLKQEKVIETDHHFCVKKKCVTEIKTRMNKIRNLESMEVTEDTVPLSEADRAIVRSAGFIII